MTPDCALLKRFDPDRAERFTWSSSLSAEDTGHGSSLIRYTPTKLQAASPPTCRLLVAVQGVAREPAGDATEAELQAYVEILPLWRRRVRNEATSLQKVKRPGFPSVIGMPWVLRSRVTGFMLPSRCRAGGMHG